MPQTASLSDELVQQPIGESPTIERLECMLDLHYNWGYQKTRQDLRDLYTKAKKSQWISEATLPWDTFVDMEHPQYPEEMNALYGTDMWNAMTQKERDGLARELLAWAMSQFLHGEQGALMAATQLVATVPDIDSKFYAATQVMDEARHVEVYDRYLHEKVGFSYPISPYLKKLLDLILTDCRWDMKLLGMQIMVEGLALAAFAMMRQNAYDPLIKKLTHYVMLDEARHVAYGLLSLQQLYGDFTEAERREREDFVYESAVLMRNRFLYDQVWEKLGLPVEKCKQAALESQSQQLFRQFLFSKIVPAVKRIGLLSPRQRERFAALGILQFESWEDPFADLEHQPAPPV